MSADAFTRSGFASEDEYLDDICKALLALRELRSDILEDYAVAEGKLRMALAELGRSAHTYSGYHFRRTTAPRVAPDRPAIAIEHPERIVIVNP